MREVWFEQVIVLAHAGPRNAFWQAMPWCLVLRRLTGLAETDED
jgi:hypothetical protein